MWCFSYFASKLVFDILRPFWSIFTECRADQTRRPCFASMWPLANFHFPFELINRDWWQWREKTKASISHKWTRFSSKWTAFVSSPVFLIYEGQNKYCTRYHCCGFRRMVISILPIYLILNINIAIIIINLLHHDRHRHPDNIAAHCCAEWICGYRHKGIQWLCLTSSPSSPSSSTSPTPPPPTPASPRLK